MRINTLSAYLALACFCVAEVYGQSPPPVGQRPPYPPGWPLSYGQEAFHPEWKAELYRWRTGDVAFSLGTPGQAVWATYGDGCPPYMTAENGFLFSLPLHCQRKLTRMTWDSQMRQPTQPNTPQLPQQQPALAQPQQQPTRPALQGPTAQQITAQAMQAAELNMRLAPPTAQEAWKEIQAEIRADEAATQNESAETDALAAKGRYGAALAELSEMAYARKPPSLKRAVFLVENAWHGDLDWEAYNARIKELAGLAFGRAGYYHRYGNVAAEAAPIAGLFSLFADTFQVSQGVTHFPFHYDDDDFYGKLDWTKQFVTKILRTGSGQCHSLALLYAVIAEEMRLKCWISMAPGHFIPRHPDGNGGILNVEVTGGFVPELEDVIRQMKISKKAILNGYYLDTLAGRKLTAICLGDLAKGYVKRVGPVDSLAWQIVKVGLVAHPQGPYVAETHSWLGFRQLREDMRRDGIPSGSDIENYPEYSEKHLKLKTEHDSLVERGMGKMTPEEYTAYVRDMEERARRAHAAR